MACPPQSGTNKRKADSSHLPEAQQGVWQRFPHTRVPVRLGGEKYLDEGVYRCIKANDKTIYIWLCELDSAQNKVDELGARGIPETEILISHGTVYLGFEGLIIYPSELVKDDFRDHTAKPDIEGHGFLVCGSRNSWLRGPRRNG